MWYGCDHRTCLSKREILLIHKDIGLSSCRHQNVEWSGNDSIDIKCARDTYKQCYKYENLNMFVMGV